MDVKTEHVSQNVQKTVTVKMVTLVKTTLVLQETVKTTRTMTVTILQMHTIQDVQHVVALLVQKRIAMKIKHIVVRILTVTILQLRELYITAREQEIFLFQTTVLMTILLQKKLVFQILSLMRTEDHLLDMVQTKLFVNTAVKTVHVLQNVHKIAIVNQDMFARKILVFQQKNVLTQKTMTVTI